MQLLLQRASPQTQPTSSMEYPEIELALCLPLDLLRSLQIRKLDEIVCFKNRINNECQQTQSSVNL